MYRAKLTDEQRLELHRRAHQRDMAPSLRDRLEMIRLSDAGWSIPKIAVHLHQHEQTVRRWIKAFMSGGFEALCDKARGGKTSLLTPPMLDAVVCHVRASPQTWSASQIADWIAERHQVRVSVGRLRIHLRRVQLSYKRTSRTLKHKQQAEDVAQKQATIETLKKGAMPD